MGDEDVGQAAKGMQSEQHQVQLSWKGTSIVSNYQKEEQLRSTHKQGLKNKQQSCRNDFQGVSVTQSMAECFAHCVGIF
jgi:hypothetical protein